VLPGSADSLRHDATVIKTKQLVSFTTYPKKERCALPMKREEGREEEAGFAAEREGELKS
jgi:hypothetical protein